MSQCIPWNELAEGYQMVAPFSPSLLVEIRKRMGVSVFEVFYSAS